MKWCLKSVVLLLGTGIYFQPSLLLAQGSDAPSQKASDIEGTSPANVSGQDAEGTYSRQNLCQIGNKLSKTKKSPGKTRLKSDEIVFGSPSEGKIKRGIPLTKVLGSLAKEGKDGQSKVRKKAPSSKGKGCE